VIGRSGDGDAIITELQRKFAAPLKGFILPSPDVGIGTHPREPLGDLVDFPAIFKFLEIASSRGGTGIGEGVVPGDFKGEALIWLQGFGKIDAHHGIHDAFVEFGSGFVDEVGDMELSVEFLLEKKAFEAVVGKFT